MKHSPLFSYVYIMIYRARRVVCVYRLVLIPRQSVIKVSLIRITSICTFFGLTPFFSPGLKCYKYWKIENSMVCGGDQDRGRVKPPTLSRRSYRWRQ